MPGTEEALSVVIVGGGFTGAAVAFHLARSLPAGVARIAVVEPRARLGRGLAYSTPDPAHRINVPAERMSLLSDVPTHFADWIASRHALADDPGATASDGRIFPRRQVFGSYVAEQLAPLITDGTVLHVRDTVVSADKRTGRFHLVLEVGAAVSADILVLATTHPPPGIPRPLRHLIGLPGIVADIYGSRGLGPVGRDDRVLLVGNGLTAADAIASLDAQGHRGRILALSRRGLRSRGHADIPSESRGDFSSRPARTALDLLRRIRREVAQAAGEGVSWHAVFDALREQAPAIWSALGQAEKARLVRHLRVFWDAHRYRASPQVVAVADRRITDGTLTVAAGRLVGAAQRDGGFEIDYRLRGAPAVERHLFDRIIIATGPDHGTITHGNPAIASLADEGLVRTDALRLGLDVSDSARAIDGHGRERADLFIAGPLARGTVGELMGLPQVTRHAERVAWEIKRLATASSRRAG